MAKAGQDEVLKRKFFTAVDKGWVKDYRPDEPDTSFDPTEIEKSNNEGYQL